MDASLRIHTQEMMERQISSLAPKIDTNQAEMKADRDTQMQEMMAEMGVKMNANQERMEAIVHSIRSERDGKIQHRVENVMERQEIPKEGAAVASLECNGLKKLESRGERREVPTEEAAVKSSGITKKQHRGQYIAAGRCIKPTKLTRGDCGSRGRLVAACRKVSRRAAVAWHRRNIFRDIRTQGNCGLRQELGAAGIMVTLRVRLAQHKGTFAMKDPTRDYVEQGACKERAFGKRHHTKPTGSQGIKNRDVKEQLRLRSERTPSRICEKKIRLDIRKRIARSSVPTRKCGTGPC
jgi:hypothetical protein